MPAGSWGDSFMSDFEKDVPVMRRPQIGDTDAQDKTTQLMLFESQKKSVGVAYLLFIFLGGLGAHRFYLGYTGSGVLYLVLFVLGFLTMGIAFIGTVIWGLIDLFLIPSLTRKKNMALIANLRS